MFFATTSLVLWWVVEGTHPEGITHDIIFALGNVSVVLSLFVCGVPMIYYYFAANRYGKRELARGYSTGPYYDGPVYIVDARSGHILRRPGESPLKNRQDVREARLRATESFDGALAAEFRRE